MIKCKQFVTDISSDIDGSKRTKWSYRMHMFLCVHCRNYLKQMDFIKTEIKAKEIEEDKIKEIENKVLDKLNIKQDLK